MSKKMYVVAVACLLTSGMVTPKIDYAAMASKYGKMVQSKVRELQRLEGGYANKAMMEKKEADIERYKAIVDHYGMAYKYRSMASKKMDELDSLKTPEGERDFLGTQIGYQAGTALRSRKAKLTEEVKKYTKMADDYEHMAMEKK